MSDSAILLAMPRYSYERLTSQDASFLELERSTRLAHAASTYVFELGPLETDHGGVDIEAVRRAIASRLHLAPRYRQRLRWIPFERHPVWVDDADFRLDYHVRHTSVPRPGGREQLREQVARIQSQRLDRSRPLWEVWILEGIESNRFGLLFKSHLCIAGDGPDLLELLLSTDRFVAYPEGPPYVARPAPSSRELVVDEVIRRARLPRQALARFRAFLAETGGFTGDLMTRFGAVAELLGYTLRSQDDTPINGRIGPHRRFAELVVPLEAARTIQQAFGTTINDVILATLAAGLRRFLIERLVHPASLDVRISLPVSTTADTDHTPAEFAEWLVDLPVWETDPATCLNAIAQQTRELAESRRALGARTLFSVARWTGSRMLSLAARHATNDPRAHLVLMNVPGSQDPLYLAGARLVEGFGHAPLYGGRGLGVSVFSYDGRLCWGLNADYDLLPDLDRLAAHLEFAFGALLEAAHREQPSLALVEA